MTMMPMALVSLLLGAPFTAPAPGAAGGALLGSVPDGEAGAAPLALSLSDAVARGLRHNLALLLAEQDLRGARGARREALGELLPHVSARVAALRQKINLEAFGFSGLPGLPVVVGPFNVVDARAAVTQNVLDFEELHKVQARGASLQAARHSYQDTRDLVVLVCGNLYLSAVADESRIRAARAQLETARALRALAADRKQAGLVPAVDLLRAQVQEQDGEQQLIVAENRFAKARLTLARAIGLPLGQELSLSDPMPPALVREVDVEDALRRAYAHRSDWLAAQERVRAAEELRRAAVGDALPTLEVSADYGAIGQTLGGARGTFTLGATLRVPLFEGGQQAGKRLQAEAELEAQRAALGDLRGRIDYEVRGAALDIHAAGGRVRVAEHALELAQEQLRQARDRFEAGVSNNIDVVQAQQALAQADESRIAAIYDYNLARATLARALGVAEAEFERLVRGE